LLEKVCESERRNLFQSIELAESVEIVFLSKVARGKVEIGGSIFFSSSINLAAHALKENAGSI
jgi:hypothetical protein